MQEGAKKEITILLLSVSKGPMVRTHSESVLTEKWRKKRGCGVWEIYRYEKQPGNVQVARKKGKDGR